MCFASTLNKNNKATTRTTRGVGRQGNEIEASCRAGNGILVINRRGRAQTIIIVKNGNNIKIKIFTARYTATYKDSSPFGVKCRYPYIEIGE